MPTEEENVQYLYLVLTNGGAPQIDWPAICAELNLNAGAASKRWSRLKQAMDAGKPPGAQAYQTLWTVFKHSKREGPPDWKLIAKKCGTTPGAAAKRYSRMKIAFETGAEGGGAARDGGAASGAVPVTPKRKRGPSKGGASAGEKSGGKGRAEQVVKPEPESSDGEGGSPKKRARMPRKGLGMGKKVVVKREGEDDAVMGFKGFAGAGENDAFKGFEGEEDAFYDAREEVGSVEGDEMDRVEQWLDDGLI